MDPIAYLVSHGFKVTSDPARYKSGIWGLRNYTVNGYNYDNYCGGYHRAYDLFKYDRAPVPAVFDGIVAAGTNNHGNFGGTVVIANKNLGFQAIYGHLARPLAVRPGQHVKMGDIIGHQSNTNYQNVRIDSHLHIQFQKYGYINGERNFVCTGINPLTINIDKKGYTAAWLWTGNFISKKNINIREFPSLTGTRVGFTNENLKFYFDKLYDNDGYWWIRSKYKERTVFIACVKKVSGVVFKETKLYGTISGLNTAKGKE